MKKAMVSVGALMGILLLAGCGGGGGSSDTPPANEGYEVTVERGPILDAVVLDKSGMHAQGLGGGRYRFEKKPQYPIVAIGGVVDLTRDGTVSAGDFDNTLTLQAPTGRAVTIVNSIASDPEARAWLKNSFGLDNETIDNATPSRNRTVAAISDELFSYCIQNNLTKPSTITLEQLKSLQGKIRTRIDEYLENDTPTEELERELVDELGIPLLTNEDLGSGLTDAQKYALAYMWNEEKLAKDIYLALNELTPHRTLENIATRSEVRHEAAVEDLVQKYDINITNLENYEIRYSEEELRALAPGQYAVPEIQELYDALYAKGSQSLQDALEVGCMVEVTDVDDLDKYIEIAAGREDLIETFDFLRSGSYNHYWAFDRALRNIGVSDGCCSLGEEFCKTEEEYPSSNGQGNGNGQNGGNGNGYHGGR